MIGWCFKMVRWAFLLPVAAGLALSGWLTLGAQPAEGPYWRQTVLDRAVRNVVRELPDHDGGQRLVVLPLQGDMDGDVQQALYTAIRRSGKYQPVKSDMLEDLLTRGDRRWGAADVDHALSAARSLDVPYVLFGQVDQFESFEASGAELQLVLRLADAPGERSVWMQEYHERLSPDRLSVTYLRARLGAMHWMVRIGLWLVFVGLLPIVFLPALRGVIQRESHAASLAAWLLLTAGGVGAALLLAGPGTWGLAVGGLLCLGGLTALGYNLIVLGEVARIVR